MSTPTSTPPGTIDLDRLMDDLKRRVQARRAAAQIDPRVLNLPFTVETDNGARGDATVRLRIETAYSSKAVVGRPITFAKRGAIRFLYHFLNDLVGQLNSILTRLDESQDAEERAREAVEVRTERVEDEVTRLQRRVATLETHLGDAARRSAAE